MPAMIARLAGVAALACAAAAPAGAVGFGPLSKEGIVDGPAKAFYLDLINPYPVPTEFVVNPVHLDDEERQEHVRVVPPRITLGANRSRRILVVVDHLTVGETARFRVCAERAVDPEGVSVHARVCSKLAARRIDRAVGNGG